MISFDFYDLWFDFFFFYEFLSLNKEDGEDNANYANSTTPLKPLPTWLKSAFDLKVKESAWVIVTHCESVQHHL